MALRESSTSTSPSTAAIDASIKLLLDAMQRIGERIEGRGARSEPCIDSALAGSASAPIYDEAEFDEFVEDDEPIFDIDPVFDEETSDSNTAGVGVVFFDEGPIFDSEPIYDEEPVFAAEPIFNEDPSLDVERAFDAGPIFDEELDYFATAGGGVILPGSLGVTTGMAAHVTTTSLRQNSTTPSIDLVLTTSASSTLCGKPIFDEELGCIAMDDNSATAQQQAFPTSSTNKELGLGFGLAAVAVTSITAVSRSFNAGMPSTCSTKCAGPYCDTMAPAEVCAITMEAVLIPGRATVTPMTIIAMPKDLSTDKPIKCSINCLSVLLCCLMNCPGDGVDIMSSVAVYAILDESVADQMHVVGASPTSTIGVTLCQKPKVHAMYTFSCHATVMSVLVGEVHEGVVAPVHKMATSFGEWKPWLPPTQLNSSQVSAKIRPIPWPSFIMNHVCSVFWDFIWVWKPPWPHQPRQNISVGGAAIFVLADIGSGMLIIAHELLPWLECELIGELVQQNYGGNCGICLLEWCQLEIIVSYWCDRICSLCGSLTEISFCYCHEKFRFKDILWQYGCAQYCLYEEFLLIISLVVQCLSSHVSAGSSFRKQQSKGTIVGSATFDNI